MAAPWEGEGEGEGVWWKKSPETNLLAQDSTDVILQDPPGTRGRWFGCRPGDHRATQVWNGCVAKEIMRQHC